MDLAAELGKARLFAQLSASDLAKLAGIAQERALNPGDVLFKEGDRGDELFVIALGTIRVEKKAPSGEVEEIATLGSGSYFGEVAIASGEHTRIASARATEKTFVVCVRAGDVRELTAGDPELGLTLYRALADGLARRVTAFAGEAAHYRALALKHD